MTKTSIFQSSVNFIGEVLNIRVSLLLDNVSEVCLVKLKQPPEFRLLPVRDAPKEESVHFVPDFEMNLREKKTVL